ncbi:MAG: hypothetical protein JO136_05625 [Hyphomicrobiales bacterium]|nr:hypothetical protein [Hyphomicrobiales bacterium]MBV9908891.1 hypothetical protein [Hyphomicrobiales bacterium]
MIVRAKLVRIVLLSTALGALTGCDTVGGAFSSAGSSVGGFLSHRDPNAEGVNLGAAPDPKQVVVQPTARPSDKLKVLPVAAQDINCPDVTIADSGAALRVGGADNASVRYQFNIADTARQCDPAGPGQAAIRIGVKGQVVIGPAGSAGTFSAPVKITVTQVGSDKPVFSQTYRAEATTDGVRGGDFRIVTDPINVPMPTLQLADVYSITVGFENGTGGPAPTGHKGRKKRTSG